MKEKETSTKREYGEWTKQPLEKSDRTLEGAVFGVTTTFTSDSPTFNGD